MRSKSIAFAFMALLLAIPMGAQTTAELLQRGIFAQETEGNLDNAIAIYRQIVQSSSPQRDLVAQAQLRLGQTLLQKGSLDMAAAEFQRLARDFGDQQATISRMAGQFRDAERRRFEEALRTEGEMRSETSAIAASTFDAGRPVTIQGTVTRVIWANPTSAIDVKDQNGDKYVFDTAAPNALVRQGLTRESFKVGQQVTVTGVLADDGKRLSSGELVARASTITAQDGAILWDRSRPMASVPSVEDQTKRAMELLHRTIEVRKAAESSAVGK